MPRTLAGLAQTASALLAAPDPKAIFKEAVATFQVDTFDCGEVDLEVRERTVRATKPPVGPQWIHEIKHDGYRLIARKRDDRVRLFTRNGFDWTERYPRIREAVASLRAASATIDVEAVWCDGEGLAIFEKLHSRAYDGEVILHAFDLLELDGADWRARPLDERKAKLAKEIDFERHADYNRC